MHTPSEVIGQFWFRFVISGQTWEVRIAPEKFFRTKKNEQLDGLTNSTINVIYLDDKLTPSKRVSVFWHEYMHAVFSTTGLDVDFAEHLKHKPKWSDVEELLCSVFSIPLFDGLLRNGWLMQPAEPTDPPLPPEAFTFGDKR